MDPDARLVNPQPLQHVIYILFLFALGACVGSFLNVVVWRLPRGESLVTPPSRCPWCEHRLAWYDNIPVFGWLMLRGRCRYCFNPISAQYPAIEFVTGALFVLYYVLFFIADKGPCWADVRWVSQSGTIVMHTRLSTLAEHWPQYFLAMFTISALLAASLIDARHYFIPLSIPIMLTVTGFLYHLILDRPRVPGALNVQNSVVGAVAVGACVGLIISNILLRKRIITPSFNEGWPALEVEKDAHLEAEPGWLSRFMSDLVERFRRRLSPQEQKIMEETRALAEVRERELEETLKQKSSEPQPPVKEFTRADIRREMRREMIFLLPALLGAFAAGSAVSFVPSLADDLQKILASNHFFSGFLGALFGALVGGFTVWVTRILGSIVFGREAMGLGDVHLMFGVGAIIGAGASVVAFFIAPFCGAAIALYMLFSGKRREIPYGPYLSLATAIVLIFYCDIADYLRPGLHGIGMILQSRFGGT